MRLRLLVPAVVAALMLMGASAQAPLTAEQLLHEGTAHYDGDLLLLAAHGQGVATAIPWMQIDAASMHGWRFETQTVGAEGDTLPRLEAPLPCQRQGGVSSTCMAEAYGSSDEPLTEVSMWTIDGGNRHYRVHVFPLMTQDAHIGSSASKTKDVAVPAPYLNRDGISAWADQPTQSDAEVGSHNAMMDRRTAGGAVITTSHDAAATMDVTGSFVIEITSLALRMEHSRGTQPVVTGEHDVNDLTTGSTPVTGDLRKDSFVRFVVEDGSFTYRGDQVGGMVQWATGQTSVESTDGALSIRDGLGPIEITAGEQEQLDHELRRYEGAYALDLAPAGDRIGLQFVALDESGRSSSPAAANMPLPQWAIAAGIGFGVLALVAVVTTLVVRASRAPSMAMIEESLKAGHYRRAAWLSGRILRKDPLAESARLSRAIAFSRAGRPRRVVRELGPYLRRAAPRDGTLHYVLGLAFKDVGDQESARIVMAQAVRLTPSLAGQIDEDFREDVVASRGGAAYA